MSRSPGFGPVDLADPEQLRRYEEAFYTAFSRVESQALLRQIWRWDDPAHRIATRIPPDELLVLATRDEAGGLGCVFAINTAMRGFQGAAYGFVPPATDGTCCEILSFFAPDTNDVGARILFWGDTVDLLLDMGFAQAVTTCGPHPLATYIWIGAEKLAEAVVQGEPRFFLGFELQRTRDRIARRSSGRTASLRRV